MYVTNDKALYCLAPYSDPVNHVGTCFRPLLAQPHLPFISTTKALCLNTTLKSLNLAGKYVGGRGSEGGVVRGGVEEEEREVGEGGRCGV
jgi:hypothetical protein